LVMKEKLLFEREKALEEMRQIIAKQDSITNRLNGILRNALLGFNSDELSVEIKNGKVYVSMSDKLLFKSGSVSDLSRMTSRLSLLRAVTFSYTPSSLFTSLVNPRSRNSLFVLGVLMLMHEMSLRKYPPQVGHRVRTVAGEGL